MVNNIDIGTYVLHIGQLMVNITAHRTFELFFRLKNMVVFYMLKYKTLIFANKIVLAALRALALRAPSPRASY